MSPGDLDKWSQAGVGLLQKGIQVKCPSCGYLLAGERFCPKCGSEIIYPGETKKDLIRSARLAKAYRSSAKLEKAGNDMSQSGCQLMGCVGFIVLIIVLFLLL
ncbi:zinc-ribbon domain-containing protein [Schleiferilactobacillus harbinensis]|uniref:zinc-ribbon domain-containing protein n=1 Tax=Schleiferilactobacillus harbinensis TaxID=304207 RepID=UPI0026713E55|nr:hypothetical protein [Schleiferilactobacillus harbinensis]